MKRCIVGLMVVAVLCVTARADWDEGDGSKMHFPQLPDLANTGLDVQCNPSLPMEEYWWDPDGEGEMEPMPIPLMGFWGWTLADDFRCSQSGPITDVHIWGSWLNDRMPQIAGQPELHPITFTLQIRSDIPAFTEPELVPWSIPDMSDTGLLWSGAFGPGTYAAREYAVDLEEGFYGDGPGWQGSDSVCWQYNFLIDESAAFMQEEGTIYWLMVEADYQIREIIDPGTGEFPIINEYLWGWKSSLDHFNDDAVRMLTDEFGNSVSPWPEELLYPPEHEFEGQSMDLAFVITPEPATMGLLGLGLAGMILRRRKGK